MCMNLNFLMLSGAVVTVPEKRVRPEDQLAVTRFWLQPGKDNMPIACKAYGDRLSDKLIKLNVLEGNIKSGQLTWILCQGRLETTEYLVNGCKTYFTELILSDVFPVVGNVGINVFMAAGRSVKDGDFFVGSGEKKAMCNSRMAINHGSGDSQKTEFLSVKSFDKKAEFVSKYIKKGTPFYAKGRLSISSYTDEQSQKRFSYDLMASDVEFTSDKKGSGTTSQPAAMPATGAVTNNPLPSAASGFAGGFNSGWGDLPM